MSIPEPNLIYEKLNSLSRWQLDQKLAAFLVSSNWSAAFLEEMDHGVLDQITATTKVATLEAVY